MAVTLVSADSSGQLLTAIKGCQVCYCFQTDSYFEPTFTRFHYEIGPITTADLVVDEERYYQIGAYTVRFVQNLKNTKTDIVFTPTTTITELQTLTNGVLQGLLKQDYTIDVQLRNGDTEVWIVLEALCMGSAGSTSITRYNQSDGEIVLLEDYTGPNTEGIGGVRLDYKSQLQIYINDIYQHDIFLIPQGSMCYSTTFNSLPMCLDIRSILEDYVYTIPPDFTTNFTLEVSENTIQEMSWSAYDSWSRVEASGTSTGLCDAWDGTGTTYITRPNVIIPNTMTIEYWIDLQGNGTQGVLGRNPGNSGIDYVGSAPRFHTGGGNNITFAPIATTGWVHQAFVVVLSTNVNNIEYFMNGVSQGTFSVTIGDNPHQFGFLGSYSLGSFFSGHLAEFRVWNDLRTPTEIADNYNAEVPGASPNLVVYYKFPTPVSSTVVDFSSFSNDGTHRIASTAAAVDYTNTTGPTCTTVTYTEQAPEIAGISTSNKFINALCEGNNSDMSAYGYQNPSTLVKPLIVLPDDGIIEICHGQPEVLYIYMPEELNLVFPQIQLVDSQSNVLATHTFGFTLNTHFNNIHYINLTEALNNLDVGDTATVEWVNTGGLGAFMETVMYHKIASSTDECCCTGYFLYLNSKGGFQTFPTTCTREYGISIDSSSFCNCEGCNNNINVGRKFTDISWSKRKRVFSRKIDVNTTNRKIIKEFFSSGDIRWYEDGKLTPIKFNNNTRAIQVNKNQVQFEISFNIAKTYTSLINYR